MPHSVTGKPYFIIPDIEVYKTLDPTTPAAEALARKIAANIGDVASLRLILGIDPPEFARFYPDMSKAAPSTFDTIDSFLEKFGDSPASPKELGAAEESSAVKSEEEKTDYDLEFNGLEPTKQDLTSFIKNKKYKEALQFIEAQNLNNTEKSIYFAHQTRFLKKLVAIENYKTHKQTKG